MKSKWWLSVAGFLAGIAVGIVVASTNCAPRTGAGISPVASRVPEPKVMLSATSPAPITAVAAPMPVATYHDRLSAIAGLNSLLQTKIAVPLLVAGAVNEDFVKVYGLTEGDVAQLKSSFAAAKKSLALLEANYASIEPNGENRYSIVIPPFPQEGGAVYDGLLQSIHEVLGDERFSAFRATASDIDSSVFGMFGLSKTTIDVRPTKEGEKPTSRSSTSFDAKGPMKVQVDTNPTFFPNQYPEIYQKMVAAGLWKGSTHD